MSLANTIPAVAKYVKSLAEGLFNTVVTGPGRIWLQTMPISNVAQIIAPHIAAK